MEIIKVKNIDTSFIVRPITEHGVAMVQSKIESLGYMEEKPIVVTDKMVLVCGHHRVKALLNIGIKTVPAIIKIGLSDSDMKKLAFNSNESEGATPVTFVDYAHFIWNEIGTHEETRKILSWSLSKVKQYGALQKVTQNVWGVIVTEVLNVTDEVTNVTFSEGLLRPIVKLTEWQQMDLVQGLIDKEYTKGTFKKQAELFKVQNKDIKIATEQLEKVVTEEILNAVTEEIQTGTYNLNLLIQNAIDEHDKKTAVKIINGDCLEELKKLDTESVDLIATDPPYNINKAEWDSFGSGEQFAAWCVEWFVECKRILKPEGSMYIFGLNRMLSHLQKWLDENMIYRNWITWDTIQGAGGGLWTNRTEAILYYSKTDDTYEDKKNIRLERHEKNIREYKGKTYKFKNPSNIWRFPCVDDKSKDRTDHITQKPVEIMERIIKASCPKGGLVCDPFSGSGTTMIAAYRNDRKAIGFENDKIIFNIAKERLLNEISG